MGSSGPARFPALLTSATSLTLGLVLAWSQLAHAGPVRGQLKLPQATLNKLAPAPRGYWRDLRNPQLPIAPPLNDPRREMVIAIEGDAKAKPAYTPTVVMRDGRFVPPVLAVRPGTKVSFDNQDWQIHLLEPAGKKGFMKPKTVEPGDKESHTFAAAGSYRVQCSELTHMRMTVLVTDKAQLALPNNSGVFRFPNVRAGSYRIAVWYRGAWIHRQSLTVRAGKTAVEVVLPALKLPAESTGGAAVAKPEKKD